MKTAFSSLKAKHYSANSSSPSHLSCEEFYALIGYDRSTLNKQHADYTNTSAARMSLALLGASISFRGRLQIKAGEYSGRMIETRAGLLADQLARNNVFGQPEIFTTPAEAPAQIVGRRGVIFFRKISGYDGGHIDLIDASNAAATFNSHCYFNCQQVWFWELS
ncbi:MAG: hypothetical protein H6R19_3076 [Proteobacteria bacterium]|nr:hypothetical protein [Pseudomonadota bacterium]